MNKQRNQVIFIQNMNKIVIFKILNDYFSEKTIEIKPFKQICLPELKSDIVDFVHYKISNYYILTSSGEIVYKPESEQAKLINLPKRSTQTLIFRQTKF